MDRPGRTNRYSSGIKCAKISSFMYAIVDELRDSTFCHFDYRNILLLFYASHCRKQTTTAEAVSVCLTHLILLGLFAYSVMAYVPRLRSVYVPSCVSVHIICMTGFHSIKTQTKEVRQICCVRMCARQCDIFSFRCGDNRR